MQAGRCRPPFLRAVAPFAPSVTQMGKTQHSEKKRHANSGGLATKSTTCSI